jgi:hypothetical protein
MQPARDRFASTRSGYPAPVPGIPALSVAEVLEPHSELMNRIKICYDNAYAESLFRTAKYRPEFPASGFIDLVGARTWAQSFGALVQRRPSSQRHPPCQPRAASCR